MDLSLWTVLDNLRENYEWIELTHDLSPETPHWIGWDNLEVEEKCNLSNSIFNASAYKTVGQYGTHVDAPIHMVDGGRTLDKIELREMVYPLCVIDLEDKVSKNENYVMELNDILEWEEKYGKIPKGAFVVFQSGWSKRQAKDMDNFDDEGNRNFPGWGLDALKFLVEDREIGAIGHETSDTESPISSGKTDYEVEYYILEQDKIQIELLKNVDKCPPKGGIIFCTFPKLVGGSGYPARCFAIVPKNK
ncbi:Kynurenine formamidase [Anaerosphaera aminiphila DSM 21120]|uniref:Kynurenine formamidase n=1 Tax=Anaerosphaera aminiphila DSM 21120 TaxID=1120995 RepID=A0A1M5T6Z7_9FIRM|nr:cyclase family protein [Anaerosphaera aminiphila]SHH46458.1 Kynurenine formamidase [Anaerosphaera aminiphila DSM 21120]